MRWSGGCGPARGRLSGARASSLHDSPLGADALGRVFAAAGAPVLVRFDEVLNFVDRHQQMADASQQARGTLAMLARWISWTHRDGFRPARTEPHREVRRYPGRILPARFM